MEKRIVCKRCRQKCSDANAFIIHMRDHFLSDKGKCAHCNKKFHLSNVENADELYFSHLQLCRRLPKYFPLNKIVAAQGNTSVKIVVAQGNSSENTVAAQGNTSENTVAEQENASEKIVASQGNTSKKFAAAQGNTSEKTVTAQGNTSEKIVAVQGNNSDKIVAVQGNNSEKIVASQGNTSKKSAAAQGNTPKKSAAAQGNTSEKTVTVQGNTSEKIVAVQGNTSEKIVAIQGNTSNKIVAAQGNISEKGILGTITCKGRSNDNPACNLLSGSSEGVLSEVKENGNAAGVGVIQTNTCKEISNHNPACNLFSGSSDGILSEVTENGNAAGVVLIPTTTCKESSNDNPACNLLSKSSEGVLGEVVENGNRAGVGIIQPSSVCLLQSCKEPVDSSSDNNSEIVYREFKSEEHSLENKHVSNKQTVSNAWKCKGCSDKFPSQKDLEFHVSKQHSLVQCQKCGTTFKNPLVSELRSCDQTFNSSDTCQSSCVKSNASQSGFHRLAETKTSTSNEDDDCLVIFENLHTAPIGKFASCPPLKRIRKTSDKYGNGTGTHSSFYHKACLSGSTVTSQNTSLKSSVYLNTSSSCSEHVDAVSTQSSNASSNFLEKSAPLYSQKSKIPLTEVYWNHPLNKALCQGGSCKHCAGKKNESSLKSMNGQCCYQSNTPPVGNTTNSNLEPFRAGETVGMNSNGLSDKHLLKPEGKEPGKGSSVYVEVPDRPLSQSSSLAEEQMAFSVKFLEDSNTTSYSSVNNICHRGNGVPKKSLIKYITVSFTDVPSSCLVSAVRGKKECGNFDVKHYKCEICRILFRTAEAITTHIESDHHIDLGNELKAFLPKSS